MGTEGVAWQWSGVRQIGGLHEWWLEGGWLGEAGKWGGWEDDFGVGGCLHLGVLGVGVDGRRVVGGCI